MTKDQLSQVYTKYLGRPATDQDINALGGTAGGWATMSPDQFTINTIFPSKEFQTSNPGVKTMQDYQATTPLGKAVSEAKSIYGPITKSKNDLSKQQLETLKQNISTQLGQAKEGLSTTLASRGLQRSGELGFDTAQLETTAAQQIGAAGLQATVQQAQNIADEWTQVYGAASGTEQSLFSQTLQQHQQDLSDLGLPFQEWSSFGQLWQGFLQSGQQIPQSVFEGIMSSLGKLGG